MDASALFGDGFGSVDQLSSIGFIKGLDQPLLLLGREGRHDQLQDAFKDIHAFRRG